MIIRAYLLSALLAVVGIAVSSRGQAVSTIRSQEWLERNTPGELEGYEVMPGPDGSDVTYRLDETRDALQAAGLVGRVFKQNGQTFDVLIVYSDRGESFHDPAGCFGAQGWQIVSQQDRVVNSADGSIPLNMLVVRSKEGLEHPAAYCFGIGSRLYSSHTDILRAMLLGEIFSLRAQEAAMYRFIGLSPGATPDSVLEFATRYMEQVHLSAAHE